MKKISVIVPVYNVGEYIDECLKSLENQTMRPDEVILINDGSTDNSLLICEQYASRNEGWQVIDQKNQGQSISRNKGLDLVTGYYILFLDSDDYLHEKTIEDAYNMMSENNLDMVAFKIESFNSSGNYGYYSNYLLDEEKITSFNENPYLIKLTSICNKMYKKELLDNLRFIPNLIHEDNYFSLSVLMRASKIGILPKLYYYRRIREGSNPSIMQKLNLKTFNDLLINYDRFIKENSDKDISFILNFLKKVAIDYIVNRLPLKDQIKALLILKTALNINKSIYKKYNINISYSFIIPYYIYRKLMFVKAKILQKDKNML